jgi:hypothetical protein
MCCDSNVKVTAETSLKCISVYIHLSRNSCGSEVSRLGPAGRMSYFRDRCELFSSQSHVNIYYEIIYDRNEMVPVWLRSGRMWTGPKRRRAISCLRNMDGYTWIILLHLHTLFAFAVSRTDFLAKPHLSSLRMHDFISCECFAFRREIRSWNHALINNLNLWIVWSTI